MVEEDHKLHKADNVHNELPSFSWDRPTYSFPFVNSNAPCNPQHRQPERHAQTIPDNIQLASLDFLPPNRDLGHWDVGAFGQHQHFNVEYPAFRVHVRDDVGERRSGKELETALGVLNCRRFGRGEEAEEQVE